MDDKTIVGLYFDRDESAITHTKEKYGDYLGKIAYNILFDKEDAEECVNDTYLGAWNSIPPHRPDILSTFLAGLDNSAVHRPKWKNAVFLYGQRTHEGRIVGRGYRADSYRSRNVYVI